MANACVSRRLHRSGACDFDDAATETRFCRPRAAPTRPPVAEMKSQPLRLAEAVQGGGGVVAPIHLRIPPYAPQRLVRYTDRDGGIQREAGAVGV